LKTFGQWSFKPNYYQYDASVLGTNTVYRLLEDPYGFIWLVSDKGILIFNGKSFETIKIPGNDQEIVNVCRYKNKVYASSYAGKLYEIDMLSLNVNELCLPEYASRHATPFTIMNVLKDKLYLSKSLGAFLILDLNNKNNPTLLSHSNYFLRYILQGDLSKVDLKEGHAFYILQKRVQTLQKRYGASASLTYESGKTGTTFKLILPKTSNLWTP